MHLAQLVYCPHGPGGARDLELAQTGFIARSGGRGRGAGSGVAEGLEKNKDCGGI